MFKVRIIATGAMLYDAHPVRLEPAQVTGGSFRHGKAFERVGCQSQTRSRILGRLACFFLTTCRAKVDEGKGFYEGGSACEVSQVGFNVTSQAGREVENISSAIGFPRG